MTISFSLTNPGCGHVYVDVTNGQQTQRFVFRKADLQLDPEDYDAAVLTLLRHLAKTNNLTTFNQLNTFLEGKTFQL